MAKRYLEDDITVHTDLDDPVMIDLSNDVSNVDYREKFTLFLKTVNVNATNIHDNLTRKRLIKMCKEYYEGNENEISFMKKFSQSYKSEEAIAWYMRGSCLHRLLSRAFNDHDLSVLVDMYSFIVDINRNLKQQCIKQSSPLRVFRGQFISNERLSLLKNNIDQTVTMQCFFSAQTSHDEALNSLQTIEPNNTTFRRILFEIDLVQDYTFVTNMESSTSKTVLFMLGAVFKIVDVTETTIKLSQCLSCLNDNSELANESPLIIRGILTYLEIGPKEAIDYFTGMLKDQPQMDLALASSIYGQLGYLHQKLRNLRVATDMYEKVVLNGAMQFDLYLYYLDQTAQYHANVLGDWEKAKNLWTQKLNIQNAFLSDKEKAQTYENLARAALETGQHAKTVEYTLAAIKSLPNDHPHLSFLQQQLECAKKNLCE
jgi:tetratricopeptide (TPR) repeat protein